MINELDGPEIEEHMGTMDVRLDEGRPDIISNPAMDDV